MQTSAQLGTTVQARPTAAVQAKAGTRLAYIDTLRAILIVLVIMVHAAVTYGSIGGWTYEDPHQEEITSILLSFFVILCQAFFMGLFFFYSGVFTPRSYDRKGLLAFWKDRLLRFGLPLIAYTFFLSRIPNFIDAFANEGYTGTFWQFASATWWWDADEGPTWFLFALLVFAAVYTLIRLASRLLKADISALNRIPTPTTKGLLAFAVVMGLFTFAACQVFRLDTQYDVLRIFSLLLAFFPQYILLFTAGILAYRNNWLARLDGKSLRFWAWLSLGLAIFLPILFLAGGAAGDRLVDFMTGLNWRCLTFSLWIGLTCVSVSMALTLWLRDGRLPRSRVAAFAGPNSFAVYLIHPLVLVPITYALSFLPLHGLIKFPLASLLTVIACFILAGLLRRIPGLKAVL